MLGNNSKNPTKPCVSNYQDKLIMCRHVSYQYSKKAKTFRRDSAPRHAIQKHAEKKEAIVEIETIFMLKGVCLENVYLPFIFLPR